MAYDPFLRLHDHHGVFTLELGEKFPESRSLRPLP